MKHLTRREWMAASLVSGWATGCWTRPLVAVEGLGAFSFATVSDTHLGRQDSRTPERQWRQAFAELGEHAANL